MVVDTVICHWESLVDREDAGPEGFRMLVQIWPHFSMKTVGY